MSVEPATEPEEMLTVSVRGEAKTNANDLADYYGVALGDVASRALSVIWFLYVEDKEDRKPIKESNREPIDIVPIDGEARVNSAQSEEPLEFDLHGASRDVAIFLGRFWEARPEDVLAKSINILHDIHIEYHNGRHVMTEHMNAVNPRPLYVRLGKEGSEGPRLH